MAEYTKGKWSASYHGARDGYERYSVVTDTHQICAIAVRRNGKEAEANADRIVACVNGCEGLNPEAVKEMYEALEALYAERINIGQDKPFWTPGNKELIEQVLAKAKEVKSNGREY